MMRRTLMVLLAGTMLLGGRTAGATEARADLLGLPNLTPDEQADLAFNPAYVHAVEGGRVFGRFAMIHGRNSNESQSVPFPPTESNNRSTTFSPLLEWVNAPGNGRWAVRYDPSFGRIVAHGVFAQTSWTQSPARGRVIYGWGNKAISFQLDDASTHFTSSGQSSGFHTYTVEAGVLRGAGTDRRKGLAVTAVYGTGNVSNTLPYESGSSKRGSLSVRATPERVLSERTTFRGQMMLGYGITDYDLNAPGHTRSHNTAEYELGAGWVHRTGEDTFWHLTAQGTGSVSRQDYESPAQSIDGQVTFHNGVVRVAVEQRTMGGRLTLRAATEPLFVRYSRNETPLTNSRSINTEGLSFFFLGGIGFQATDRLALDLQLGQQSFNMADTDSQTGTFVNNSESVGFRVNVSATYRL
jgi:hypothetical protein